VRGDSYSIHDEGLFDATIERAQAEGGHLQFPGLKCPLNRKTLERLATTLRQPGSLTRVHSLTLAHAEAVDLALLVEGLGHAGVLPLLTALHLTDTKHGPLSAPATAALGRIHAGPSLAALSLSATALGEAGVGDMITGLAGWPHLTNLDLTRALTTPGSAVAMAQALARPHSFPALTTLDPSWGKVGDAGLAALASALAEQEAETCPRLATLHLQFINGDVTAAGIQSLGPALGSGVFTRLTTLRISSTAADALFPALGTVGTLPRLTTLELAGRIPPANAADLGRSLATGTLSALTHLRLSTLALGDGGLTSLASAVAATALPSLQELDLQEVGAGSGGVTALAQALGEGPGLPRLTRLVLANNPAVKGPGVVALAQALARRPVAIATATEPEGRDPTVPVLLADLNLQKLGFGSEGGAALGLALLSAPMQGLTSLDLAGNGVAATGLRAIADALRRPGTCPLLRALGLGDNGINAEGAKDLARVFATPGALPCLATLSLSGNKIGDDGLKALVDGLAGPRACPRLAQLDVRGVGMQIEGMLYVAKTLMDTPQHQAFEKMLDSRGGYYNVYLKNRLPEISVERVGRERLSILIHQTEWN
jgi:hypothetical protein